MIAKRLIAAAAFLAVAAAPALAQTAQPSAQPAKPAATAPAATPAKPAAPTAAAPAPAKPAATSPVVKKTNLNTATAQELEALPQIGPARAKAIVEARGKTKFKNWEDFVARGVVPSNAEAAIKDQVSF